MASMDPNPKGWNKCQFDCTCQECERCHRRLKSGEWLYWRSVDYWSPEGEYWCLACCNTEITMTNNEELQKQSMKHMPTHEATCRYQHTADELRLVVRALETMNTISGADELALEGSLDLFWAGTIMGRIARDDLGEQWVYLPTARGEKPEVA